MPNIIITKDTDEGILGMIIKAVNGLDTAPNPHNTTGTGIFLDNSKGWSNDQPLSKVVGVAPFQTDFKIVQRGK